MLKHLGIFILSVVLACGYAFGQASLLPNAKQTFIDINGAPLASGTVDLYVPNTSTRKNSWTNSTETTLNTNPILLDAAGRAVIFGQGTYRQVVKDSVGSTQWDAVTSAPSAGTATFLTDAAPVGTMLPYAGIALPTNYLWAGGQAVSRTTFSELLTATTISQTGTTITGNLTIAGLTDTSQVKVGAPIEGPCLSAGTTIATVPNAVSVTVSAVATSTGSCAVRVFPYGAGNGSSTFNVPDMRSRVPVGRDNLNDTAAGLITANFCISGAVTLGINLGTNCGAQNHVMSAGELAAHTHASPAVTDPGHLHLYNQGTSTNQSAVASGHATLDGISAVNTSTSFTGITLAATTGSLGNNTPFSIIQPSLVVNYIIKYQAESPSDAGGVISVGGMTGDILCGAGLTCASGTISVGGVGTGDVVGPASSVNSNIAVFNGVTGKLIADSGVSVSLITNTITALSGDVTAAGPGSVIATLATVNANVGSFGSSTSIPNFTVNAKGLITAAGSNVVIAPAGTLTGATLASNVLASSLTSTGTLTGGATGAGFTVNFTASTLTGTVPVASGGTAAATAAGARTNLGAVNVNGDTMTGLLILSGDPAANLGAATKQYVDAVATGLQVKSASAVATTANITLSGEQTIDGVLTSTSRVLVKNQTAPAENGIYVSAAGAWARATDIDAWSEVVGAFTFVTAGSANANTGWVTQVVAGGTINVTAMPWAQFSSNTAYTAGAGLTLGGTQFSISAGAITNAMLAGSIASSKLVATDIVTVGALTTGSLATGFTPVAVPLGGTGISNGASGGVPYFSSTTTIASSAAGAVNAPMLWGGAGAAPTAGTRTGTTTAFATATGTVTGAARCAEWDTNGNLLRAAAACSSGSGVTSITAGTGLTGGTITTTGTIALDLTAANVWTGNLQTNASAYFKNGKPWSDVIACGAVGNGVGGATATANTNAFDACVTIIQALGGGDVFVPPGTYCVKPNSGSFALNYTGINNLRLICAGPQGACAINACTGDGTNFTVIRMNGGKNALVNMTVNGANPAAGVAPTGDGVLFDTSCTECYTENSKFLGGNHAFVASAADIWLKDVNMDSSYGSSLLNVNGAVHMVRGKLDQAWPCTEWAVGASISAWAATTAYSTNAFVSRLGYIFQACNGVGGGGGTSGGTGPVVTTYGTNITDGTVTWRLVAPSTYAALEFTGGGASSFVDVDMTGPYLNGVAFTSGSPQLVEFTMLTFGGPRNACVYLNSGSQVSVTQSKLTRCGLGLQTDAGWTSEIQVTTSRIYQNSSNGIQLGKPLLANINSNTFSGNGGWGIAVAGQANMYSNVNSNLFISNTSGAVDVTGSGSTQCNVGLNSSNGQTYTLAGCTGTANN